MSRQCAFCGLSGPRDAFRSLSVVETHLLCEGCLSRVFEWRDAFMADGVAPSLAILYAIHAVQHAKYGPKPRRKP